MLLTCTTFRHFTNTLAFAVVASIIFMLWSIKYHKVMFEKNKFLLIVVITSH